MNRQTINRILTTTTIGVTAALLTVTAAQTEARPVPSRPVPSSVDTINHTEPTLNQK